MLKKKKKIPITHKDPYVPSSDLIKLLFVLHVFYTMTKNVTVTIYTFLKGFLFAEYSYSEYIQLLF